MVILGIDEVGRGPLAGPLVIGAVVLPGDRPEWVEELRDSKKLSAKKREGLSEVIWREAEGVGLGWVSPKELDEVGISKALRLATRRAVKSVQGLHANFSQIVIDGKVNFLSGTALAKYVSVMPKADDLVKEVSAASIVAKVARDAYMREAGTRFPEYGFEKHMGYGTLQHREEILKYGVCPEHRRSFEPIRSMVGFSRDEAKRKNTSFTGTFGEEAAVRHLVSCGHTIVARNFKTYFYEIDIVSVLEKQIYFTEVKYRKSRDFGGGLAAVDAQKVRRMRFAAECFLKYWSREFGDFDPLLAVADVVGEDFMVEDWFALD